MQSNLPVLRARTLVLGLGITVMGLLATRALAQMSPQPISVNASGAAARMSSDNPLRVVVAPFESNSAPDSLKFLDRGLPVLLRTSLLSDPGIVFVETDAEVDPAVGSSISPSNGDLFVKGRYFYYRGSVRLEAAVQEVSTGNTETISSGVVDLASLYSAVQDLSSNLKASLSNLRTGTGAKRLAVTCFADASLRPDGRETWAGNEVGEYLSAKILSREDLTVLPWKESRGDCTGGRPRRIEALLQKLRADAVLTGVFEIKKEEISFSPQLFLSNRKEPLRLPTVTDSTSRLSELENLLVEDTQGILAVLLSDGRWRSSLFAEDLGADAYAEQATSLLQKNENLPLALWMFHRLVELTPDDAQGHAGIGAVRLLQGHYGQALRELTIAERAAPRRADIQKLLGDVYLKMNRIDEAVSAYQRAATQDAGSFEYSLRLGEALHIKGDYPRALQELENALQKNAPPDLVYVAMANVQRSAGALPDAEATFRKALASNAQSREARVGLSEILYSRTASALSKRNLDTALQLLSEAKELNPTSQNYTALAFIFNERRQYEEVLQVAEEAGQASLTSAGIHHHKAFALIGLGRREEALRSYDEAIRLAPDNMSITLAKVNLLIKMSRWTEARALLAQIDSEKASPEIRIGKASGLARLGEYDLALSEMEAVLKIDPKSASALNAKGFIFSLLGRFEEAVDILNQAIRLDAEQENAHSNKAFALGELGRYKDAVAAADKAMEVNPKAVPARSHKGYSLYRMGNIEEGLRLIQEAIETDPAYGGGHYNLARVYAREHRVQEALSELTMAIEKDPRYRTLADRTADFDELKPEPRFQSLLKKQ